MASPSASTGRLVRAVSYIMISSSPSGRMSLPLVDPTTGKLEHYALVKLDQPASTTTSGVPTKSDHHLDVLQAAASESIPSQISSVLRQLPDEHTTDLPRNVLSQVSSDALRVLKDDKLWSSVSCPESILPSSLHLKVADSPVRLNFQDASLAVTPSLVNESQPSILSDPSFSFVHTPSRGQEKLKLGTEEADAENKEANTGIVLSSGDSVASIGLGITGITNEDGSPFNGLGILPRVDRDAPVLAQEARAELDIDEWLYSLRRRVDPVDRYAAEEDPRARFWRTATASDFRALLDSKVKHKDADKGEGASSSKATSRDSDEPCWPNVSAEGSLRMVAHREKVEKRRRVETARQQFLLQQQQARRRLHRQTMPCVPAQDDVFMAGLAAASTPAGGMRRASSGYRLMDISPLVGL